MLTDAITSLGGLLYSVATPTVNAAAYDSHGRATAPASPVTSQVRGLLVPLSGRDISLLTEGLTGKEVRYFFTTAALALPLASDGAGNASQGSVLTAGSEHWVVRGVQAWAPYNRYLLSRLDP